MTTTTTHSSTKKKNIKKITRQKTPSFVEHVESFYEANEENVKKAGFAAAVALFLLLVYCVWKRLRRRRIGRGGTSRGGKSAAEKNARGPRRRRRKRRQRRRKRVRKRAEEENNDRQYVFIACIETFGRLLLCSSVDDRLMILYRLHI